MSRAGICGIIVAVTAAVSVWTLGVLKGSTAGVIEAIDRVIEAAESGDSGKTERALDELEDCWREHYLKLSFLVQSGALGDISYAAAKLRGLYENGADDFIAECEGIKAAVRLVLESQEPRAQSVF